MDIRHRQYSVESPIPIDQQQQQLVSFFETSRGVLMCPNASTGIQMAPLTSIPMATPWACRPLFPSMLTPTTAAQPWLALRILTIQTVPTR